MMLRLKIASFASSSTFEHLIQLINIFYNQRTNSRHRDNTYNVFPGVFETVEMQPKHKGTWLLHCHVHDHLEGGMETRYTVYGDYKGK